MVACQVDLLAGCDKRQAGEDNSIVTRKQRLQYLKQLSLELLPAEHTIHRRLHITLGE